MKSTSTFSTYHKFPDSASSADLINLLETHAVPFEVEDNTSHIADSVMGSSSESKFIVKIRSQDFDYVNRLMDEAFEKDLANLDPEYPLLQFSNQELMEVIDNQDEWSRIDLMLAKKLLKERGFGISEELIEEKKKERIQKLSQYDEEKSTAHIFGYIMAFAGPAIGFFILISVPGSLGLVFATIFAICAPMIGLLIRTAKKTLPDGTQISMFSAKERKHGKILLVLGSITCLIYFILVFKAYYNYFLS